MKLSWENINLELRHVFTISRSSMNVSKNVLVKLEHEGITGFGEAAPSGYYGQSRDSVVAALEKIGAGLGDDPFLLEDIIERLVIDFPDDSAAVAAVDMALHDWIGKKLGVPLWKLFGLNPEKTPLTSFTIGIDTTEKMMEKVAEAEEYPVLKIKVGTERDGEILTAIRKETDKKIRVDANAAWNADEAIEQINAISEYDIEFVEQPVPAGNTDAFASVRKAVDIELVADESSVVPSDVPKLFGCTDGINIKLAKCSGIRRALKMIHAAKSAGMKVMLGCMIESSVGITAAAQLSPLVDYADLDGNLLVKNDIASGVKVRNGKLILPDRDGLGLSF